jgi:DNA invertase Pin-like site-specific DNA recombinase
VVKAKLQGKYKGRKPTARAKSDQILELDRQGLSREGIASQLGIGVASVYRVLKSARMAA